MCFHAILGKNDNDVWSCVKIVKVMKIERDILFEGLLQNFLYVFVRAKNVEFEFMVFYFLLKNMDDLISITKFLINMDVSMIPETNRNDFILGFCHIWPLQILILP